MSPKRNTIRKVTSKLKTKRKVSLRVKAKCTKTVSAKKELKKETKKETKKEAKVEVKKEVRKEPEFKKRFSKEELVLEYRANARKLSRSILRRWRSRIELEELDSLVDLALCEAADRYDSKKGASFMTFLYYHLRGTLVRAVDIAANLNTVSAADYEIEELISGYRTSKDSHDNGITASADLSDTLSNHEYSTPDEMLYKKEVANISNQACAKLDELEQEVIYRLYVQEEQLVDIAKSLGYSRCHISRVKKRALDVLHEQLSPALEKKGRPNDDDEPEISRGRNLRKTISRRKYTKEDEIPQGPYTAPRTELSFEQCESIAA